MTLTLHLPTTLPSNFSAEDIGSIEDTLAKYRTEEAILIAKLLDGGSLDRKTLQILQSLRASIQHLEEPLAVHHSSDVNDVLASSTDAYERYNAVNNIYETLPEDHPAKVSTRDVLIQVARQGVRLRAEEGKTTIEKLQNAAKFVYQLRKDGIVHAAMMDQYEQILIAVGEQGISILAQCKTFTEQLELVNMLQQKGLTGKRAGDVNRMRLQVADAISKSIQSFLEEHTTEKDQANALRKALDSLPFEDKQKSKVEEVLFEITLKQAHDAVAKAKTDTDKLSILYDFADKYVTQTVERDAIESVITELTH